MCTLVKLLATIVVTGKLESVQQKTASSPDKKITSDLLFPNSGLLLSRVSGFIEQGKHRVIIHYADGISHFDDHTHTNCGSLEDNVNLIGLRKYFTKYVGEQLDHGGFDFVIDEKALQHLNDSVKLDHASTNVLRGAGRRSVTQAPKTIIADAESNSYDYEATAAPTAGPEPTTALPTTVVITPPVTTKETIAEYPQDGRNQSGALLEGKFLNEFIQHLRTSIADRTIDCTESIKSSGSCQNYHHLPRVIYSITVPKSETVWLLQITVTGYKLFEGQPNVQNVNGSIAISYSNEDNTKMVTLLLATNNNLTVNGQNGNVMDSDNANSYLYIPFLGDFTKLRMTFSIEDQNFNVTSSHVNSVIRRLNSNPVQRRNRRSWFFGLQTKYEVDQELGKALQITRDWKSLSRTELDSMAKLIKQNDLSIIRNTDTLSKLYDTFCEAQAVNVVDLAKVAYRSQIMMSARKLLAIVHQCSHGMLPDALDYKHVYGLCLVHLSKDLCERMGHKVRDIMTCENYKIRLTPDKYLVSLTITIPQAMNLTGIDIFMPLSVPVFDGKFQHSLAKLDGNYVMKYRDENSIVLLNDCRSMGTTLICNPSQSPDDKTAGCLHGILQNSTQPCFTESFRSNETCFTKSYDHGIIVSTRVPMEVHMIDPVGFFRSKAKTINGVHVISNTANKTFTVSCNGLLSATKMTEPTAIEIYDEHQWILADTLTPVVNKRLHEEIEDTKKKTEETMLNIASNITDIENDHNLQWQDTYPSLSTPHGTSSLAIYLSIAIATFILTVILGFVIKHYCCKKPRIQVISTTPSITNPAYLAQTAPFITTPT